MNNALKKNSIGSKGKILVIDDEPDIGMIFNKILTDHGYEVISTQSGRDGLKKLRDFIPLVVFLDLILPDENGIDILKEMKKLHPDIIVIMMTGHSSIQTAVKAVKLGAYDYIPKPVPIEGLMEIIGKAAKSRILSLEKKNAAANNISLNDIIGRSEAMQKVFDLIKSVASYDVNVIIKGESGTGKELVACAIHSLSKRRDGPFIPLDCSALPDNLIESELFGYERGAFTGADDIKLGRFERAEDGTIFLDEIGNLAMHIQSKLLRFLQSRKVDRLGGRQSIKTNIRVISATNTDLEKAISEGRFREDLYHRLNVFEIIVPPLRDRGDDTIALSRYFLEKFNKELGKDVKGFSSGVMELFRDYHWPGNVRELENIVESTLVMAEDRVLFDHIPPHIIRRLEKTAEKNNSSGNLLSESNRSNDALSFKEKRKEATETMEKLFIERTLNETNWNKKKASEYLGIDYKSLFNKIKKYDLKRQ